VLASIDPKLNIAQYKEIGPIKRYTDRQLMYPNIKDANARELAKLIISIRKNPNSLLSKVSKSTGIPLNVRAKAISTAPSKSTQAQLQSPTVKESIELFQEAFIDDMFTKLGVSNEDINANKYKVISYLGSMYASEGNTDLSIVNTDNIQDIITISSPQDIVDADNISVSSDITFGNEVDKTLTKKYKNMNVEKLREECKEKSLNTEGTKAVLISRILEHNKKQK
jgi:hypothetical protein